MCMGNSASPQRGQLVLERRPLRCRFSPKAETSICCSLCWFNDGSRSYVVTRFRGVDSRLKGLPYIDVFCSIADLFTELWLFFRRSWPWRIPFHGSRLKRLTGSLKQDIVYVGIEDSTDFIIASLPALDKNRVDQ